ncbi:RDD family protein [Macrococcus sp. DPC7161]|nr:RDD family protein [Macrococcus sp. DPC7161]
MILFLVSSIVYLFLGGIPNFTELQAQLISTFTAVVPIILLFTFFDSRKGSPGKRKLNLKIIFNHHSYLNYLLRNIMKFLPWQIAHIGIIRGMYTDFDLLSQCFTYGSLILLVVMLYMGLITHNKRHLADYIVGSRVIQTHNH